MPGAVILQENIQDRILVIRGKKVMLGKDLARLYSVENRMLNQAVKRNVKRFPSDFMLRLDQDEVRALVSQNVIPSHQTLGGHRLVAFTEHGILMLSSVLKSERAIEVNIQIMRTFTRLREMMVEHRDLREKIETMEKKYDKQFAVVFEAIRQLIDPPQEPKERIGFRSNRK